MKNLLVKGGGGVERGGDACIAPGDESMNPSLLVDPPYGHKPGRRSRCPQ
jgi:hypothetical protein